MSRWGRGRRARDARGRSVGTPGNYLVDDREVSRGAAVRPRASRPSPHPQRDTDLCRHSLVLCPVNNGTKSLELAKDRIGGGGPQEGASLTIIVLHELVDLGDELRHAGERAATDGALGDERKPALNLIEPGRIRRREVEMIARMPRDPATDRDVLVRPVVVHDQVD